MGLFDGVLGGIVGGSMVSVVNGILEKHGGVQGVVNEFERNGFGQTVQSWVGTGPNDQIAPADIQRVIGPDLLQKLSERSGISQQDLAQHLAQILPRAVDHLTPNGVVPK
ncbi:MAG TPA: YidB family protein [Vicinamibacterales bacterium]|nr:YidB family protein [Vicinamibacterales bacterium]